VSRGGGAYRKRLAERVAAGAHTHKIAKAHVPKSHYTNGDVVRLVAREARIDRGRESLLESSEYADVLTSERKPSAETHRLAPPVEATPWRNTSPNAALYAD
jgi:hypothetical protein